MKRRRTLILLICLLLVGVPMGLLVSTFVQQQHDHDLVNAIKIDNTLAALSALKQGADPNALDYNEKAGSPRELLQSNAVHNTATHLVVRALSSASQLQRSPFSDPFQ